ncbi:hypothetical protein Dimus_023696 [Dionaea muscipula]
MWESCLPGVSLSDHRRTRRRTVEAALLHLQTEHRDILAGQRALMERHQQIIDWQRAQDRRMQTQSDQLTWIIEHLRTRGAESRVAGLGSKVLGEVLGSSGREVDEGGWLGSNMGKDGGTTLFWLYRFGGDGVRDKLASSAGIGMT